MAEDGRTRVVENLARVIGDLRSLSGDLESCAVLSSGGELVYSSHGEGVDRERVSAMLKALTNLSKGVARRNGKGRADQTRIRTDLGYVILVRLENGGTLAATTGPEARVGLALYDMRNVRQEIERAMEEGN